MFERAKFAFYTIRMSCMAEAAVRAQKAKNNEQALSLLKKTIWFGHSALCLQNAKINEQDKNSVKKLLIATRNLYKLQAIAQMIEYDQELCALVAKFGQDEKGIPISGFDPLRQMARMIEIARDRLDSGKEALRLVYDNDHVPAPIRKIMQAFIADEATREETERQLDAVWAKLKHMDSVLFPKELLLTL